MKINALLLIIIYLALLNLTGFLLMGIDKHKARVGAFRIPELTLFAVAMIGGSLGSIIGMYLFHHKTRHALFKFGMPAILILQLLLVLALILMPIELRFL